MLQIFANSSIGTDFVNAPTDPVRQNLGCATAAELAACHWVKTDAVAFVVDSGLRFGLAHVRVAEQVPDLERLKKYLGDVKCDVYLIGGFAPQPGPADAILKHYSLAFGYGVAPGVNQIYGHVKKPQPFTAGRTDDTGHVPGFAAMVGTSNYWIGTHSLFGCVAVLVVPQNTAVAIRKIHIYDATHTVGAIGAYNTTHLKTQILA